MTGILNLLMGVGGALKDTYFNLVSLLLPGNGTNGAQNNTFLDSSTNNFTITRNGDTTQGTFSPFSQTGWSNYYNGSGYFSSSTALFAYTTGNASTQTFTIEAMVYHTARTTPVFQPYSQCIAGKGNVYMNFGINGTGNLIFLHNDGTERIITSSSTVPLNSWTYVAVVVSGGTATMYINNSSVGSGTWYGIAAGAVSSTSYFGKAATAPDANVFQGYISNLRVSSTARTAAVPTSGYTNDGNTVFLFNSSNQFVDKSSNAYPITVVSNPSVTPFSPFAPTSSYSAAAVGGSGYFDGTGDFLEAGTTSSFNFMHNTTATFTFQGWIYPLALPGSGSISTLFSTIKDSSTVGVAIWLVYSSSSVAALGVGIYRGVGGSPVIETAGTALIRANTWQHVAVTYDQSLGSANAKFYIDGVAAGTATKTANTPSSSNSTYVGNIGRIPDPTAFTFNGYISNLRIDNSVQTISVPTAPLSTISGTQLLLNFTNAGVVDATAKNVLETEGNAQISNGAGGGKWGGGSIAFDGSSPNDYLRSPTTFIFSGDFVIEGWMYFSSASSGFPTILCASTANQLQLQFDSTGANYYLNFGGTSSIINNQPTGMSTNTWTHFAVVRSGTASNNISVYFNGTRKNQATSTASVSQTIFLGADSSGTNPFNGYLDDFRITVGTTRGYSGASITVPTAPFPLQ